MVMKSATLTKPRKSPTKKNTKTKLILKRIESRNRVHSMALLHEKLYKSKDFNRINFIDYINELALSLVNTYSGINKKIELEINSNIEHVNIDLGVALGLMINEFICNCMKHAFKEVPKGKFQLILIKLKIIT